MRERIKQSSLRKQHSIRTIDMHTAGEPLRVVIEGYPSLEVSSVLELRKRLKEEYDHLRTRLMYEPRGHADMYGLILHEPFCEDSAFSTIFIHNEGYSTMCGHATIAITKLAVEQGWVQMQTPCTTLKIDAPCGQLTAHAYVEDEKVKKVAFESVPSFVVALDESVEVEGLGEVVYDLAYGGAFYAYVDADALGLSLESENYTELIHKGMAIKHAVMAQKNNVKHPYEEELSFLYGTIFVSKNSKVHSKNVCVFANGEVDRSPTGSGVSGRIALAVARGEVGLDEVIEIESIIGSSFEVSAIAKKEFGGFEAVVAKVEGEAFYTGEHHFIVEEKDALKDGFFLR